MVGNFAARRQFAVVAQSAANAHGHRPRLPIPVVGIDLEPIAQCARVVKAIATIINASWQTSSSGPIACGSTGNRCDRFITITRSGVRHAAT
jgi:hypothetical protein